VTGRTLGTRSLAAAGVVAGLALVTRPRQVADAVAPTYPSSRLWVARLLGVRLLVQHAAVLAAPRPAVLRAAAAVDGLHAASMVPLLRSARYGRAARVSGGAAAGTALVAVALASERR
jgi:hypothetical protein